LGDALSVGFARRQVSNVPLVTVQVTEHRLHKVRCDCGHVTAAEVSDLLAGSPTLWVPITHPCSSADIRMDSATMQSPEELNAFS
jgi:hypothetical protein